MLEVDTPGEVGHETREAGTCVGGEAPAVSPALGGDETCGASSPFLPLQKGVNLDVARPDGGVWFKMQYEAAQVKAIAEAGFESVRVFMPFRSDPSFTQRQIDDAHANGLYIVVCLWGMPSWSRSPRLGESQV